MEKNLHIEFRDQRYGEINQGDNQDEINALYAAYAGLRELPLDYRQMGNYQISNMSNGSFGYFRRSSGSESGGRSQSQDTKHVYHFGSQTRQAFQSNGGYNTLSYELRDFCDAAEVVYWRSVDCFRYAFSHLWGDIKMSDIREENKLSQFFLDPLQPLNIHLRLIATELPKDPTGNLLEPHYDRSVFTLLIDQTKPGLEINTSGNEKDFKPINQSDRVAQIIAGKGWLNMPSRIQSVYPYINPAYHRVSDQVSNNPDLISSSRIVRESISAFANPFGFDSDPSLSETRPQRYVDANLQMA